MVTTQRVVKLSFPNCPDKLEVLSVCHVDKKKKKNLSKKPLYIEFWLYTFPVKLLLCHCFRNPGAPNSRRLTFFLTLLALKHTIP